MLLQVGKTEKTRRTNKDRAFNLDMCRNVCVVVWVGGGGGGERERDAERDKVKTLRVFSKIKCGR